VSTQYFRFSARAIAAPRRAALLELLLARADGFRAVEDWRADAFQVLAPQSPRIPAIAAAALFSDCAAAATDRPVGAPAWVCLASPVRYLADMTSVRLAQDGILPLTPASALTLAADFNRVWQDSGCRMIAGASAHLYCAFDRIHDVATRDPEDMLEQYIEEYLPAGADAPSLRRLMSEIEMWLFEHEVNRDRETSGLPRISGLWLWGGGAPLAALPAIEGWIAGADVFFSAFRAASASGANENRSGVIITPAEPGSPAWLECEQSLLKPASTRLRSGSLSRLEISAGRRCFTLTARAMRRFWRRSKPWWESFA
jgi:hypothetical protein